MLRECTITVHHIISEPGDATRYDYLVNLTGLDEYSFAPVGSTFRFPQRLNYWEVLSLTEEQLLELAKEEHCNPWTLKECIRFIMTNHT